MPNRIIREGILSSEPVNALSWPAEVFYRRLLNVVDDYGRFSAHPTLIRAAAYPLRLNDVSDQDVGKWLAENAAKGLVRVYEVDCKRFLEVVRFGQRVRAEKSKCPQPPDNSASVDGQQSVKGQTAARLVVVVDEGVVGEGCRSRGTRLTLDALPDDWETFCRTTRPDLDPHNSFAAFRDYWIAKPGKDGVKLDWAATWRNWVRRERLGTQFDSKRLSL